MQEREKINLKEWAERVGMNYKWARVMCSQGRVEGASFDGVGYNGSRVWRCYADAPDPRLPRGRPRKG